MACVGQTCEHRVAFVFAVAHLHLHHRRPEAGDVRLRAGGWMALVGHTFMHSPQRMHLARKSSSASAPGGRISAGLNVRLASGWMRNSRPRPKPAAPRPAHGRRPRSSAPAGAWKKCVIHPKACAWACLPPPTWPSRGNRTGRAIRLAVQAVEAFRRLPPPAFAGWRRPGSRPGTAGSCCRLRSRLRRTSGFLPTTPSSPPSGQM